MGRDKDKPMNTLPFRQQHARILKLGTLLGEQAKAAADPTTVNDVLATLEAFTAELVEHLEQEDGYLYPAMIASDDGDLSALAARYRAEMGGITDLFHLYRRRWTAETIRTDPLRFARETGLLLDGLVDRVRRENEDLYPAAEKMTSAA